MTRLVAPHQRMTAEALRSWRWNNAVAQAKRIVGRTHRRYSWAEGALAMANAVVFADDLEQAGTGTQMLFRSIGTDATGFLLDNASGAWHANAGAWSISSNVVTPPTNAFDQNIVAGSADWWDLTYQLRFQWLTPSEGRAIVHWSPGAGGGNYITTQANGSDLRLTRVLNSSFQTPSATVAATLVSGTQYWLQVTCSGTTYTAKIFADNAGAINLGSQVGLTATATITDAVLQSGKIGMGGDKLAGALQYGGAFPNVCTVTGPAPLAWTPTVNAGEPAFCWSQSNPYSGKYSLSITIANANAQGYWVASAPPASTIAAGVYAVSAQIRTTQVAGVVQWFFNGAVVPGPNQINTSGWQQSLATVTLASPGQLAFYAQNAVGVSYVDNFAIYQTSFVATAPAYSVPADARYGKRGVVQFGGLPVPIVGGTQTFIDLMDGVGWFLDDKKNGIEIKTDHRLVSAPYLYRAKSVVQSEDYYPVTATLDLVYSESSGVSLQNALGAVFAAGAQYLTFDNATGLVARLVNPLNRRMRVTAAPYLWEVQLEFIGYEPWWKDFNTSTLVAAPISGSVSPGTHSQIGIQYLGNVFGEPVFTLAVPSSNAAPISQLVLRNLTNLAFLEQLTAIFVPALAAGVAWTITIDCGALTVTDQNGVQYDFAGSFPLLYAPTGGINDFLATLITTAGSSSGVTLAASWVNRWTP